VLGQKYTFTTHEIARLKKEFDSINHIIYKDIDSSSVIEKIENILETDSFTVIVLNTKATVDDELVKYLTNLKYKIQNTKFKIISIELFLEDYLYKCYIPEDNTDLHYLSDISGYTFFQKVQKKIIDLIAIFFLFLIFPIVRYIANKNTQKQSSGELYFRQPRVGLNNREFECIKFRTMHEHDSENDVRTAIEGDNRIFPWGETMRRYRIDEIPQIFNVFRGELHLIGPRAEWNKLTVEYEKEIPFYNQRHIVTPGITGWAQVMFVEGRSRDDTRQKLMYDLYYIKHWSMLLEIKTIFKTIMVVLGKKGI